jgi:hypothetical protein
LVTLSNTDREGDNQGAMEIASISMVGFCLALLFMRDNLCMRISRSCKRAV